MTGAYPAVGVIGAGAWGTALAQAAARAGRPVVMWARTPEHAEAINTDRENRARLPGAPLHPLVRASAELAEAAAQPLVLCVAPVQHTRDVLGRARAHLTPGAPIVLCAKGLERGTLLLPSDVAQDVAHGAVTAVLSGPSFASDVVHGRPAAVTLACPELAIGGRIAETLNHAAFRPYLSQDVIGAQIGGAVKNVLAIACGVVLGRDLGMSAHAALITRGFAEMLRLGAALGARPETLQGLCGFGDLVLTCSSRESRNMSLGYALGQGQSLDAILGERKAVTEGVFTAPGIVALAERTGVDMPICTGVAAVLAGQITVNEAIDGLMARPLKTETA